MPSRHIFISNVTDIEGPRSGNYKMSLKHKILDDLKFPGKIDFEVLLLSSMLIERYRYGSVSDAAVDKEFDRGPPTKKDIAAVTERLVAFIHTCPPPLLLQQTITTLGRCADGSISDVVTPLLEKYLGQLLEINTVVYACMVALDECGAVIFSRKSFGLSEFDQNITDASRYLKEFSRKKHKSD